MTQDILDGSQVSSTIEQVGRTGMTQHVGMGSRHIRCVFEGLFHDVVDHARRESLTVLKSEERIGFFNIRLSNAKRLIIGKCFYGFATKRHDTALVAFAEYSYGLLLAVDIGKVDAAKFGAAKSARVKQLDHGLISERCE